MKIINIMQGTNLGGMEQASLRMMIGLKVIGYIPEVLSLNPIGNLLSLLNKHAIVFKGLPYHGKGGWRSFLVLKRELRGIRADALIMTGHHLLTMIAMGDLCKGKRVLAIHFHHKGVKPEWQWRIIYRLACIRFQAITFPSDFVRKEAEDLYPPVKLISHIVRNPLSIPPVPSSEDRNKARQFLGIADDAKVIGNAGWLISRKRFDVFLHVAQKIVDVESKALFLIAGDGEDRFRLEALAKRLNISDNVRWLGWQKDLTPFFQCLDVMLFNSDWDAMGLSPLEAMSYGVPLVASVKQGGLKEIISKEDYGFLIPSHDVPVLANKIVDLLKNPQKARAIALAGRQRVSDVSNLDGHVKKIESLLFGTDLKNNHISGNVS